MMAWMGQGFDDLGHKLARDDERGTIYAFGFGSEIASPSRPTTGTRLPQAARGVGLAPAAAQHEGTKDTKDGTSTVLLFFFVSFVPFVPSW